MLLGTRGFQRRPLSLRRVEALAEMVGALAQPGKRADVLATRKHLAWMEVLGAKDMEALEALARIPLEEQAEQEE